MATGATVGMIWAQAHRRVIGWQGNIPWQLPEDLAHFRAVTSDHPVVMGRRTWESLPAAVRPLPGRRNVVVSRRRGYRAPGAEVVDSLPAALARVAEAGRPAWLIGGAELYAAGAAGLASVADVTEIDLTTPGDTFAPTLTGWIADRVGAWHRSRTGLRYRHLRYRCCSPPRG